ncbi:NAD(P)-dependent alcohol dehydrogenase [Mycobacterium sp. 21AC1]|uniref:NAD(P)-dependent alcohol dehydrogenase n=1 Tax=[Mycobacterium] appelbergii TaxID=2939269 RepID=UPI0029392B1E|nr:NAD(P)-dependent alcohol dehydrogenase [Mycobacterium sp. 21AC1]MDV3126541.1 NAD(P)-dependent alcohol dehydrogenase [Mycobacterium sp. 21AC1]
MRSTSGWAADAENRFRRVTLQRRDLRDDDLAVRIDYCGVCHTDLHALRSRAADDSLLVPGHEFTGVVTAVGDAVSEFVIGDPVAVGNIVDSCGVCSMCRLGQENFCHEFPTLTYGGTDRRDGSVTLGGFSGEYIVRARFAYALPPELDAAAAAPLMCAGITVWEPLRGLGVGPRTSVAVAGLGGLGHLAVKFLAALGAETTVIGRSPGKADDALGLGASAYLNSTDQKAMAGARECFDVILDTIPVAHDLSPYLTLTALDGTLCQVGFLGPVDLDTTDLLIGRKRLTSAGSGGRPATAEMLKFSAQHGIGADVEVLPSAQINESLERLARNDVRYRFVLDMSDLHGE